MTARRHLRDADMDGESIWGTLRPKKDPFKIRAFTDNIVIGYPISDDGERELGAIFSDLSSFQLEMVNRGFFIRGAIAVGDLYMDDITVFGQGFLNAYDGESKYARDPRIILTESAQEAVMSHVKYYSNPSYSPQARDLYKDADGQFFLNYLEGVLIAEEELGPYFDVLASHKSVIEAKLNEHRDQPVFWAKYTWAANYHNFFCDQYRWFSDEHKIDVNQFQMQLTRII
jgi:hypothetical protein